MSYPIRVPSFPIKGLAQFFTDLIKYIDENDGQKLNSNSENFSLLLRSNNGSVYEIKVSDAGALSATKVGQR